MDSKNLVPIGLSLVFGAVAGQFFVNRQTAQTTTSEKKEKSEVSGEQQQKSDSKKLDESISGWSNELLVYVNGKKYAVKNIDPRTKLITFLREHCRLISPKEGCSRGVCGACTVMVSTFNATTNKITHRAVNSCLTPVCDVNGKAVITVEGLGSVKHGLHPVQQRFHAAHASQCGYCTPGMVMSFYALLRTNPSLTSQDIVDNMDGNLCRCTGYRPIMSAMKSFASDGCCGGGSCENCPGKKAVQQGTSSSCSTGLSELKDPKPFTGDADFIFPPALKKAPVAYCSVSEDGNARWFAPNSLQTLREILAANPTARPIGGNGGFTHKEGVFVSLKNIPEFTDLTSNDASVTFGAARTLEDVREFFMSKKSEGISFDVLTRVLGRVASRQVRGNCTAGGNVVSNEWHGDLNAALIALGATANIITHSGDRSSIPLGALKLSNKEFLASVTVPKSHKTEFARTYKIARRDATSRGIVCGTLKVDVNQGSVTSANFVFSCISTGPVRASAAERFIIGKPLSSEVIPGVLATLQSDVDLAINGLNVDVDVRKNLVRSFLFKFLHSADAFYHGKTDEFPERPWPVTRGVQTFAINKNMNVVGQPYQHASGDMHTTGEAQYTGDMSVPDCLHGALVLSKKAHAKIIDINIHKARTFPGVVDVYIARDCPNNSVPGLFGTPGEVFAVNEVKYVGHLVGIVVADTPEHAAAAAEAVQITYEDLPALISIDEALKAGSVAPKVPILTSNLSKGDVEAGKTQAQVTVKGEFELTGAEHWYLEPHAHLVVPGERNEFAIFTTAQGTAQAVSALSTLLGIPASNINCTIKRLGGSFGGKGATVEQLAAVTLAAYKTKRPVKLVLKREIDLIHTAKRGNFKFKYSAGANRDGKIVFVEIDMVNNGGYSPGFGAFIMMEAVEAIDNCYVSPNFKVDAKTAITNRAMTSAMRGAGKPQAMALMETIIEHLAHELKMDPMLFRELNFYKTGDETPFHQKFTQDDLAPLGINWKRILESSDYKRRRAEILQFNSQNKYKKRGISIIPTRYPFHPLLMATMSTGTAIVSLLPDGSVVLLHGGVEMGQGLHTKLIQICAQELGISADAITTPAISAFGLSNAGITGGSTGTDNNGEAIRIACKELLARLEPLKKELKDKPLKDLVALAAQRGMDLTARARKALEPWGNPMTCHDPYYYSWNVAVCEVELDVLTGHYRTTRADIVQDVGQSLSPMIDVGQVEGGFVQGASFVSLEDLETLYKSDGVFDLSVESYEIASFRDIPVDMRVELTPGIFNPKNVHSSKGIGEPSYSLGIAVTAALRSAISSARAENNLSGFFTLNLPATRSRVLTAISGESGNSSNTTNTGKPPKNLEE